MSVLCMRRAGFFIIMSGMAASSAKTAAKSTVLVLGASGLTGTEVVRCLADAKVPVRVSYREASELSVLRNFGVEMFYVDYNQLDSVAKSMQGIDTVIVILPIGQTLAEWGRGIVDYAKQAGVRHFVYLSNVVAAGESDAEISRAHREVETHLNASGLAHTIIRPAPYYQNMLWSSIAIMRQGRFSLPLENAKIPHIDMRDVAVALSQVAQTLPAQPANAYNILGPEPLSMFDIARVMSAEIGGAVKYSPTPLKSSYELFRNFGWTETLSKLVADMHVEYVNFGWDSIRNDFKNVAGSRPRPFKNFVKENKMVFAGQQETGVASSSS